MESEAERLMEELSRDLGLPNERQDWGIINADPTRVREFLMYFDTQPLAPSQRFALGELIIASVNEAILGYPAEKTTIEEFVTFFKTHRDEIEWHLRYWTSLPSKEFPVSGVIRQILLQLNAELEKE